MRYRIDHRKYFGCTTARCRIVALALAMAGAFLPQPTRADCWPPLNAREERQSNPVRVGRETFTTGYYSWYVEGYRVDNLHCEETINEGPRQWSVIVGLGGDEPIGPRVSVDGKPSRNTSQSTLGRSNTPAPQNALPTPPLPNMPALPTPTPMTPLPSLNAAALPDMPALPRLAPIPDAR